MTTATWSSKGQIPIPASVRSGLGIETGDRVEFVKMGEGHYEGVAATLSVTALKGLIAKPAQPISGDEMNAAIRQPAAEASEP